MDAIRRVNSFFDAKLGKIIDKLLQNAPDAGQHDPDGQPER